MPNKTIEDFAYQVRDYMRSAEVVRGKNKFNNTKSTTTINNVLWTVNADKSVTATNTATGNSYFDVPVDNIPAGRYYCSLCPTNGSTSSYLAGIQYTDNTWEDPPDYGEGIWSNPNKTIKTVRLAIIGGYNANGVTFYPMICTEDDWNFSHTYEPYYVPVKDRFDYVKIAEANANQTWTAQLSTLHTAYSALSDEDKMRCVISAGDNFAYGKYSLQAVSAEAFAMNNLDGYGKFNAICLRLSNQTAKMVNIASGGTTTLTDLSSETNTIKMVLYKMP